MLPDTSGYDLGIVRKMNLESIDESEIGQCFDEYISSYESCFSNKSQRMYFKTFARGLLSNLDRKTIEPIALAFMGESGVRGFQQFFKRSSLPDEALKKKYYELVASRLSEEEGFLCVDGSDFAKKGGNSVGVHRQHCGRLGKTENCQAGVFASYAGSKGYGLLDSKLYLPKAWFSEEYKEKWKKSQIPKGTTFETKNAIALSMINGIIESGEFAVKWVGCDAAFGCDHKFLSGLPKSVRYFAATREGELVFRRMPQMHAPEGNGPGRPRVHEIPDIVPVKIKEVAQDESIPWEYKTLAQGAKGPIDAWVKCLRVVSARSTTQYGNYIAPDEEVWLYIRKYEDGTIKYFLSNAPDDIEMAVLDRLATMRWSIEQCFQECKSHLGMAHYETITYIAWHRHMRLVMVAHLFTQVLREGFKKTLSDDAHGQKLGKLRTGWKE